MASPTDSVAPDAPTLSSIFAGAKTLVDWLNEPPKWIKALSPSGASKYDTGWVNVTISTGFTQQGATPPRVRRIGKRVYLEWGWSNTGMSANGSYAVGVIPDGYRPVGNAAYATAVSNTVSTAGRMQVSTSGTITINTGSTLGSYYLAPNGCSWMLD